MATPADLLAEQTRVVYTEHTYDGKFEMLSNFRDLQLFEKCDAIFIDNEILATTTNSTFCLSSWNISSFPDEEDKDMYHLRLSL